MKTVLLVASLILVVTFGCVVVHLSADPIECDVKQGGLREAILYSCGANTKHGFRRSPGDTQRAVALNIRHRK